MPERVRVTWDVDLRRRRLVVSLLAALALPFFVALVVWSLLVAPAIVLAWVVAVVRGSVPSWLHRFLRAYLGYATRLGAWTSLVARAGPRVDRRGRHPVQLDAERAAQPRLRSLFRLPLALPGLLLGSVLSVVLGAAAVASWFVALVLGRTTEGLRELGAFCLRYQVEVLAFLFMLTPRAPKLEPPG